MAGLDPRFILMSDLQSLFRDVSTGLPMAAGWVYTYQDINRTNPKTLYQISGTPPNYTYTPLPNPVQLTGIGTFSDGAGNDIIPYYYPYTGTPTQNTGVLDLYYVVVKNSAFANQFTREGLPNITAGEIEGPSFENFIPNGQFLAHTNLPANPLASPPVLAGQVTQAITNVSYGGWTFERPSNSTATDFITFDSFGNFTASPPNSPKYAVRVNCQTPGTDNFKDLRVKFTDVNKFASTTQNYIFAFWANSNGSGSVTAQIYLIKNFGQGGPSDQETLLGSVSISNTGYPSNPYQTPAFVFGINTGITVGAGDNVQLAIRFPGNAAFNVSVTDAILTTAPATITSFPVTPDAKFLYQSLAGGTNVPDYSANDLYCPQVLTPSGMQFDHSQIGYVYASTKENLEVSYLSMNGAEYQTTAYSSDGIPYARLQQKWWDNTLNAPIYGTGDSYMTASAGSIAGYINLHANAAGALTQTAGSSPFTFNNVTPGINGGIFVNAYWVNNAGNPAFIIQNITAAAINTALYPDVANSGFTLLNLRDSNQSTGSQTTIQQIDMFTVTDLVTAGHYFRFQTGSLALYYVWYKVNGSGSDPAPGGTGILVNLNSSETTATIAQKTAFALNGFIFSEIVCPAASSITGGYYFTTYATSGTYVVWYQVNGVGTDPHVGGATSIQVTLTGSETATQVATKTIAAINSMFFKVPNIAGYVLRGNDPSFTQDYGPRFSPVDGVFTLGTYQFDQNLSHYHLVAAGYDSLNTNQSGSNNWGSSSPNYNANTAVINSEGYQEARMKNFAVNWVVKY